MRSMFRRRRTVDMSRWLSNPGSFASATVAELPKVAVAWFFGLLLFNTSGLSLWHTGRWAAYEGGLWFDGLPFWQQPILWSLLLAILMLGYGWSMRLQIALREGRAVGFALATYIAANGLVIALFLGFKASMLSLFSLSTPVWLMKLSLPNSPWIVNQILPATLAILTFASLQPRIRINVTRAVTQGAIVEVEGNNDGLR